MWPSWCVVPDTIWESHSVAMAYTRFDTCKKSAAWTLKSLRTVSLGYFKAQPATASSRFSKPSGGMLGSWCTSQIAKLSSVSQTQSIPGIFGTGSALKKDDSWLSITPPSPLSTTGEGLKNLGGGIVLSSFLPSLTQVLITDARSTFCTAK